MVGSLVTDNWLTIIGLHEDGPDGLPPASRRAIENAEIVIGPPRHLAALTWYKGETVEWPAPFREGLPKLLELRGRRVVALASGDPFWFGSGSMIAQVLEPGEWRAIPGPSVFSLIAARLGWPLQGTQCRGLHAAPFARLRRDLAPGRRFIVTMRDGPRTCEFAKWLSDQGFGDSEFRVFEALASSRERHRACRVADFDFTDVTHPITVAFEIAGEGEVIGRATGHPDALFENDGQITKRPVRALTLSALQPCPGERLWDIGAGSGSIALEWLLTDPSTEAVAVEARADRAAVIRGNAEKLGQDRLMVVEGQAPEALGDLPPPDAVFVGGGLDAALLDWLEAHLDKGTRLVANAVTLETEALVVAAQARLGGALLKVELSEPQPLGRFRGWKAAYPVVQWSVTL